MGIEPRLSDCNPPTLPLDQSAVSVVILYTLPNHQNLRRNTTGACFMKLITDVIYSFMT